MTDSLITELDRSPDADLRRVGRALAPLSPSTGPGIPRASEALAEFLAVPQAPHVRPDIGAPVPTSDLVIQLGSPAGATRRQDRRLGLPGLLGGGLFAKAVLGAAVVLAAGAGLAAVAGPLGHDTVVVTPSTPTATSTPTAPTNPTTDDGHEGRAHIGDADDGRHQRTHRAPGTTKTAVPAQPAAGQQGRGQATDSDGDDSGSDDGLVPDEPRDDDSDDGSDDGGDEGSDDSTGDGATSGSDEGDADPGDGPSSGPSGGTQDGGGDAAED